MGNSGIYLIWSYLKQWLMMCFYVLDSMVLKLSHTNVLSISIKQCKLPIIALAIMVVLPEADWVMVVMVY